MTSLVLSGRSLEDELERIISFIQTQVGRFNIVVGLSGGIDSDVTARLCHRALGSQRLKCFTILQDDFEPRYIQNVHNLADDLGIKAVEIPLSSFPGQMISILADSDPQAGITAGPLSLDIAAGKNALRTFINAIYAEHGHLVMGTTNRTELELGYFLPLGDHIAHICPIMHLYKIQVRQLAQILGTRSEVLSQQPAAGLWSGDDDLIGIASWIYNGAPLQTRPERDLNSLESIRRIHKELSFFALDQALVGINQGRQPAQVAEMSKLSRQVVEGLVRLRSEAFTYKRRPFGVGLALE